MVRGNTVSMPISKTMRDPFNGLATFAIGAILLVSFYYQGYRYPFQIGDSSTSPTYVDTPPALQIGKYVLLFAVLAVLIVVSVPSTGNRRVLQDTAYVGTCITLLILGTFGTLKGILQGSLDLISFAVLALIAVGVASLSRRWRINYRTIARMISVYAVISVLFDALQIVLFQTQGRLPSLAYASSVSVRFGAVLDDPNGFGLLVPLLLPVVAITWRRHKFWRLVFVLALLGCLVLTQSFTAITVSLLAMIFGYLALNWRNSNKVVFVMIGGLTIAVAIWAYTSSSPLFQAVLGTKVGSINDHARSIDALHGLTAESWFGLGAPAAFIESGYVYLLANYGVIFTVAYICIGIAALPRLHRTIRTSDDTATVAVHSGAFFYLLAQLGAAINLNVMNTFPNSGLYFLAIVISMFPAPGTTQLAPEEPRHIGRRRNRTAPGTRNIPLVRDR